MGAGFDNPVVQGDGSLIRVAIKSPNYVAGVSGWTIKRDGSVEFNNALFRGTVVVGSPAGNVTIQPSVPAALTTYYSGIAAISAFSILMSPDGVGYYYQIVGILTTTRYAYATGFVNHAGQVQEYSLAQIDPNDLNFSGLQFLARNHDSASYTLTFGSPSGTKTLADQFNVGNCAITLGAAGVGFDLGSVTVKVPFTVVATIQSTFAGPTTLSGATIISGTASLTNTVSVSGIATFTNAVNLNGGATINNGATIKSAVTVDTANNGELLFAGTSAPRGHLWDIQLAGNPIAGSPFTAEAVLTNTGNITYVDGRMYRVTIHIPVTPTTATGGIQIQLRRGTTIAGLRVLTWSRRLSQIALDEVEFTALIKAPVGGITQQVCFTVTGLNGAGLNLFATGAGQGQAWCEDVGAAADYAAISATF